ncbi:hypothetical protein BDF22DRAFT_691347 [Syncephalis plumigaleata]|nr:hypothetical protein BDF22DRAFT_691347 [Syncephalis plumigaleata]
MMPLQLPLIIVVYLLLLLVRSFSNQLMLLAFNFCCLLCTSSRRSCSFEHIDSIATLVVILKDEYISLLSWHNSNKPYNIALTPGSVVTSFIASSYSKNIAYILLVSH